MAVYTQVSAEALTAFLAGYDVGALVSAKGIAEGVENSNYLVETSRARFILTLYEKRVRAEDLPFFLALTDHLAAKGLPVPPAVRDRAGQAIQQLCGRAACLITFLPGVALSHPTPAQAAAAGEVLGAMHRALADFPLSRPNAMGQPSWQALYERCGTSLETIAPGLHRDLGAAIARLAPIWDRAGLDRSVIHADLFPDNLLMLGDRVTGVIDFYFACTDIRLYDLAVMDTSWAFDASGTHYDPAISAALKRGYARHFALRDADEAAFADLCVGACLRFTLSRAWDWLNTPADALVTRKDPLAYWRRIATYAPDLARQLPTLT